MFSSISFLPMITRIRQNKFLPNDCYHTTEWADTDTKELFEENLRTQPEDWYYRHKSITYKNNSHGYRTKEFKDINWSNSIVVFGCSHVYGTGLDESDTISSNIEKITGINTINLGLGGTSMIYAMHNSIILREGYPRPRAVIYLWPDYSRCTEYFRHTLLNHGAHTIQPDNIMGVWNSNDYNVKVHAIFIQKNIRLLWQDTLLYEASFFIKDTADLLKCNKLSMCDFARDMIHPGIQSAQKAAMKISKDLKLI